MSDVKFSQFASASNLEINDIVVGLRSGVNTQFNFGSMVSSGNAVYVDSTSGINAVGRGGASAPYLTISYALSQITGASQSNPFIINAFGTFTDTNWSIPPNIFYNFNNGSYTVTNQVTLDASWSSSTGNLAICNLFNYSFPAGILLDFNAASATSASLYFYNLQTTSNVSCQLIGSDASPCNVFLEYCNFETLSIESCNGGIVGCQGNDYSFIQNSFIVMSNFTIDGSSASTSFLSNYSAGGGVLYISNSLLINPTFIGSGPGSSVIYSIGNRFLGALTLNGSYVAFYADILESLPTLVGGATYTPFSIANSINSNFTPSNYTPVDVSVTGNLEGINNEFPLYFKISNDFSEISSSNTDCRANLGIGTGYIILDVAQNYILTNPTVKNIVVDMPSSGFQCNLAPAGVAGGLDNGEYITITSYATSASILFADSSGTNIATVNPGQTWIAEYVGSTLSPLTGWVFRQVNSSGGTEDMQETYNQGSTISMAEGQPIVISAGSQVVGSASNLTTLYSNSLAPAPSTSYVIGMSFTMNQNGYISALGYADPCFSSGTREVGLWLFNTNTTGTLLATANVSKSDPLDAQTNKWRMAAITPVAVADGARYVVAELNPTTDQWLFYQWSPPYFCIVDGWSQDNYASATLVYPPIINQLATGPQWGNSNFQFESATGYTSTFEINDLTSSIYFNNVNTFSQVSQPLAIGTIAQQQAIGTTGLNDGALWNNTSLTTIDRYNLAKTAWYSVNLGPQFITASSATLVPGEEAYNYATGLTTFTMPTTMLAGQKLSVIGAAGKGVPSSWKINLNGGQQLFVGNSIANTSVASTYESDCIVITCVFDNSKFVASSFVGALTTA